MVPFHMLHIVSYCAIGPSNFVFKTRRFYDIRRPGRGPEIPEIPEILKSVLKCPEIH